MATFDYGSVKSTAIDIIQKFGEEFSVEREGTAVWNKSYEPSTSSFVWTNTQTGDVVTTEPTDSSSTYNGIGVLTDVEDSLVDGKLILVGDKILLTSDIEESPKTGDTFTVNGVKYEYIRHQEVSPAKLVLLYKIYLRK